VAFLPSITPDNSELPVYIMIFQFLKICSLLCYGSEVLRTSISKGHIGNYFLTHLYQHRYSKSILFLANKTNDIIEWFNIQHFYSPKIV
jgi:hypothetical protein